jgi:hypothetical protein
MLVSACLCLLYEADLSFHVFWGYGTSFEASDILLVFAVLFGFSGLLQTREIWMGGLIRYIQLVLTFLLSAALIFVRGHYFPQGAAPQWVIDTVPSYVDIIFLSRFQYPQESSMVLSVCCFAFISLAFCWIKRTRPRAHVNLGQKREFIE